MDRICKYIQHNNFDFVFYSLCHKINFYYTMSIFFLIIILFAIKRYLIKTKLTILFHRTKDLYLIIRPITADYR